MNRTHNVKITSTELGELGRGMSFFLNVEGEWSGSIGGRALYSPFAMELIISILDVVGVSTWEELTGKNIRAIANGGVSLIHTIGHIVKDNWLNFDDFNDNIIEKEKHFVWSRIKIT